MPGTTSGRLVQSALDLFGRDRYEDVSVQAIARHAEVTTGSLYHHFASKAGLYSLVRRDVERRVADRLEGAAALQGGGPRRELSAIVLVGFDYVVRAGLTRLLAQEWPTEARSPDGDQLVAVIAEVVASPELGLLVGAAWRESLRMTAENPVAEAREALRTLLGTSLVPRPAGTR
ncbi:TetR/AcrR family transcriptional regulator [Nocardioides mangrovicus]|uniref:TetR/AcrR family transcriptional regulator n=1 Tax=Nocardioides mangrovicus TaxID=2478913 RepID=UPI0022B7B9B9|nr:TetR/AcrR family transcriptional regulator [Nocardioides mangrovicus]